MLGDFKQLSLPLAVTICSFYLLFFSVTTVPSYGQTSNSSAVVINEIEISPSESGGDESAWIELLNTGDNQVYTSGFILKVANDDGKDAAGNTTDLHLNLDNRAISIPPKGRQVIPLPAQQDFSGLVNIQLFDNTIILDEVQGINDSFADSRTWQRFPDGKDSGHFEDWVFGEGTKGKNNGDLGQVLAECYLDPFCMTLKNPMHKVNEITVNGTVFAIDTFSTSQTTNIEFNQEEKKLLVQLSKSNDETQEVGFIHITLPNTLMSGDFLVGIDNSGFQQPFFSISNNTHSRLVIEYVPGERTIEVMATNVVPEFGSMFAYLLAVLITIAFSTISGLRRCILRLDFLLGRRAGQPIQYKP